MLNRTHTFTRAFRLLGLTGALLGILAGGFNAPAKALQTRKICVSAIEPQERARKIPNELLTAIATVESGR
jgi:hypothetical protein